MDLGDGSNRATISQRQDGGLTVTSDGASVNLTELQARNAVIRGGEGNDRITVDSSVRGNLRIEGGNGNDILVGGNGDDYLQGGAGDDRIEGGAGRDSLYGLDGRDTMLGGTDRDYMDGGAGDDTLNGNDGDDQVIGGRGNDTLSGDMGNDALAAGEGRDRLTGGAGRDALYVQENDSVTQSGQEGDTVTTVNLDTGDGRVLGSSIRIEGDEAFQARVQSDLDALRSLPEGRSLLRDLDNSGRRTTIFYSPGHNYIRGQTKQEEEATKLREDGTRGRPTNAIIGYDPVDVRTAHGNEDWTIASPNTNLFHELVHAYNMVTGTWARGERTYVSSTGELRTVGNHEWAAVGLPYDHDSNPVTPDQHPGHTNENRFRDQLNIPLRLRY